MVLIKEKILCLFFLHTITVKILAALLQGSRNIKRNFKYRIFWQPRSVSAAHFKHGLNCFLSNHIGRKNLVLYLGWNWLKYLNINLSLFFNFFWLDNKFICYQYAKFSRNAEIKKIVTIYSPKVNDCIYNCTCFSCLSLLSFMWGQAIIFSGW